VSSWVFVSLQASELVCAILRLRQ